MAQDFDAEFAQQKLGDGAMATRAADSRAEARSST